LVGNPPNTKETYPGRQPSASETGWTPKRESASERARL